MYGCGAACSLAGRPASTAIEAAEPSAFRAAQVAPVVAQHPLAQPLWGADIHSCTTVLPGSVQLKIING